MCLSVKKELLKHVWEDVHLAIFFKMYCTKEPEMRYKKLTAEGEGALRKNQTEYEECDPGPLFTKR